MSPVDPGYELGKMVLAVTLILAIPTIAFLVTTLLDTFCP